MAVQSPCIGNCHINTQAGLCEGCWRTVEEIAAWPGMIDGQRQQLVVILERRRAESARFD